MDYEPEMKIIHCNDPAENPILALRKDEDVAPEIPAEQADMPDQSFFPFFCKPVYRDHF